MRGMTPQSAAAPSPLPTGTVTFLFTDIEGSTRLWESHAAAMRAALARHDGLLRACIDGRAPKRSNHADALGRLFRHASDA